MNKTELVAAIAEKAELSKKSAEAALKAFEDVVAEELKKGEKIQMVGFGTFEVSERAAREGRNPQTGETMTIAASKAPKFKAGKALKDMLNQYSTAKVNNEAGQETVRLFKNIKRISIMRLDKYLKLSRLINRRTVAN